MSKTSYAFGLDMAPTHGALSLVHFEDGKPAYAERVAHFPDPEDLYFDCDGTGDTLGPIFSKNYRAIYLISDAWDRANWTAWHMRRFNFNEKFPPVLYIDYSVRGVAFMPSGRLFAAKWSFVMGGFFAYMDRNNFGCIPIPPELVRAHFGLPANKSKADVYKEFEKKYPEIYKEIAEVKSTKKVRQDYLDAALLPIVGGA